MRGYLPTRWPSWFNPFPLDLASDPFGPFATSRRLTTAGDVVAVGTPGHTADHISVLVEDHGITYVLAGDVSYNARLMLDGHIDGVCANDDVARATLRAISQLARNRPTVYLPTHDPESAERLSNHCLVDAIRDQGRPCQRPTNPE
jgi:glyoxylase-like metal-dependent hydrolase (beta-lactamase superfamily II)